MDKNTVLIIFWVIAVAIITIVIVVIVLRNRKWKITIQLPKETFAYGEQITWNFDLLAKKAIIGNWIFCELVGYVTTSHYNPDTKRNEEEDTMFYTDKVQIESATNYPIWYQKSYPFTIKTPSALPPNVVKPSGFLTSSYTWAIHRYLRITLDAKGLDLHARQLIYIN
jgi:hypothetical protein